MNKEDGYEVIGIWYSRVSLSGCLNCSPEVAVGGCECVRKRSRVHMCPCCVSDIQEYRPGGCIVFEVELRLDVTAV